MILVVQSNLAQDYKFEWAQVMPPTLAKTQIAEPMLPAIEWNKLSQKKKTRRVPRAWWGWLMDPEKYISKVIAWVRRYPFVADIVLGVGLFGFFFLIILGVMICG